MTAGAWAALRNSGLLGLPTGVRPSYEPMRQAFDEHHARLLDREGELHDLRERVEAGGYVIVEGDAYAGKTALMAHLGASLEASHSRVVRFYVVERSQDTPAAFLPAAIVQLLDLVGEGGGVATDREGQVMQFTALWHHALTMGDGRLVLLVDGLDEQDRVDPVSHHLPPHCPSAATVVVYAAQPGACCRSR